MESSTMRNFVFISYNHKDVKWARWLQKKLEWYRLPTEAHNELADSRYIRPVFRDRDTLTAGVLNTELRSHLEASKYLVVLCSPNSAQSTWVSDEIKAFIEMGRFDKIVPFIVEGSPKDYKNNDVTQPLMGECFPLALRQWNQQHPDKNLLGIAVTDDGMTDRQKAFIRLVAHLLEVDFDALWHRHKRFVHRMVAFLSVIAVVALALAYWFMIPVKLTVTIKDEPSALPSMESGVLTVNGSEYTISQPDTTISVSALPGYCRLRTIPLSFHANRFYLDEEQELEIGTGVHQAFTLNLHRDSTFAIFAGTVFDGSYDNFSDHPLKDAVVKVGSYETLTDVNGHFRINIPLADQQEVKPISIERQGYQVFHREDESPNDQLSYLLQKL